MNISARACLGKVLLSFILVFTFCSCGEAYINVYMVKTSKTKFFMSTNSKLVEKYRVIKRIDLYELIPELGQLDLTKESFWYVQDVLKEEVMYLRTSYVVLEKSDHCDAELGYCYASYLDRFLD